MGDLQDKKTIYTRIEREKESLLAILNQHNDKIKMRGKACV